jgi:acetyl-CoA synthetase
VILLNKYTKGINFESYQEFFDEFEYVIPEKFNFGYDVVDEYAEKEPQKLALVWCNPEGERKTITFGELKTMTDKTANYFASLGIGKGDAVMLILKRHYEFWYAIIALHKLGAICIPATHLLTQKDLVYRNNAADVKMIVAVNEPLVIQAIDDSEAESPTLKTKVVVNADIEGWNDFEIGVANASATFVRPTGEQDACNEDIMLLYFTSGTTGHPKMVQHNYTYPLGHITTAKFWQNVKEDKLHFTVSDTGWAKSAWGKLYGQWLAGAIVFVYDYDKFVPDELLTLVQDYKIATFCAPPTMYRFFIKEDLSKYDLSCLEHAAIAGEPLNPEVYNQFLKATGLKLMEGYGQTELTITAATFPWMEPKPGSMGRPTPGYHILIVDENGKPCDVGIEGQIVIDTDKNLPMGIFGGYYRDAKRTESVWHDGYYYTGDMAWQDEDGYLWFVGRADDVIKSSGYRIGPFEVESALMEHPAVLECAITAVPDEVRGQVVKATIVVARGYEASDELAETLKTHVKKTTAPYKYPRIVEFVKILPKTISGKIRRVEIRESDE